MKKIFLVLSIILLILSCKDNVDYTYKDQSLSIKERVDNLLGQMTLKEKIGQITQVETSFLEKEKDIYKYYLGSLLSGGGNKAKPDNLPKDWVKLLKNYVNLSIKSRLAIPIIYGIDAVHGHNNVKNTTIFPHNIGLGATRDFNLVNEIGKITAKEVSATGIPWNFAPCIAIAKDIRWGRTYESYGEDANLVTVMGEAFYQGLEGGDPSKQGNVLATPKHFVADGATYGGYDRGNALINETQIEEHIKPYIPLIESGTQVIMVSFSSINGTMMHGNKSLLIDKLREELGFEGVILSDYGALKLLKNTEYKDNIIEGLNAGIDMVMVPDDYKLFISLVEESVLEGSIIEERLNDAVRRILTLKFNIGLMDKPHKEGTDIELVGSDYHRDVAREAVRKSLVLLKNDNNTLPIKENSKVLILGDKANDLGVQCGGWTIEWQGDYGDITKGTTILEAFKSQPSLDIYTNIDDIEDPDYIIVVGGEEPYAEGKGDRTDLILIDDTIELLNEAEEIYPETQIITLLISGRPMIINEELEKSDAFVALWLPGTEGLGITDVLLGIYDFQGTLSFSWPKSMGQLPLDKDSDDYDPLFPYTYGLRY